MSLEELKMLRFKLHDNSNGYINTINKFFLNDKEFKNYSGMKILNEYVTTVEEFIIKAVNLVSDYEIKINDLNEKIIEFNLLKVENERLKKLIEKKDGKDKVARNKS